MSLFEVNPGLIFWTIVNFLLLAAVLGKFAFKPLLKMIAEREQKVRSALEGAEQARQQASEAARQAEKIVAAARAQAAETVERARKEAESISASIVSDSRLEAQRFVAEARSAMEREREKAAQDLRSATVEIAMDTVKKVLGEQVDEQQNRQLIGRFLSSADFSALSKRALS